MRSSFCSFLLLFAANAAADVLLVQDFEGDSIPGWRDSGSGTLQLTSYAGNTSLRLTKKKAVTLSLSTAGFSNVAVSVQLAADSLERSDRCFAEVSVDGGDQWSSVLEIGPDQADGVTLYSGSHSGDDLSDNDALQLRFRAAGKVNQDYCWADNVRISGSRASVGTARLSRAFLFGEQPLQRPLPMAQFAPSPHSVAAAQSGNGRLELDPASAAGFEVLQDRFNYLGNNGTARATFPAAILDWTQVDGFVIPQDQSVQRLDHPAWDIAFQTGQVWHSSSSSLELQYSLPFALVERDANCTHNGVLTWAVDAKGQASRVAYQIASETCAYFKFDMWGTLQARMTFDSERSRPAIVAAFHENQQRRLPVREIAALTELKAGIDPAQFGAVATMEPRDSTVYGLVVDGQHYRSACPTRYGDYPYCDELLLPSFSTAKSIVAGLALMRLEVIAAGAAQTRVATLLPECAQAGWQDITIEDALDLATGRYLDTALEVDEALPSHVAFLYAPTHREKIDFACSYFPRKAEPGKVWAYHSSDTYVAGAAMRALLERNAQSRVDIYRQLLVEPMWDTLALSAAIRSSRTTDDDYAQPLFGWGLSYQSDDIARIGVWLQAGAPLPDGISLDPAMLNAALQRNPDDRGLQAGSAATRYNNGFWGLDIAAFIGCEKPVWVPFMSGHGGISVVLFPNNTVYYHFADGYVYRWREAAIESNKIRNMCL